MFDFCEEWKFEDESQAREGARKKMKFQILVTFYLYIIITRCVILHLSDSIFLIYSALKTPPSGDKLLSII